MPRLEETGHIMDAVQFEKYRLLNLGVTNRQCWV